MGNLVKEQHSKIGMAD